MPNNDSVILVSNAYWPSIGGVENSLRHLAQEGKKLGDNVCVVVSDIGLAEDVENMDHQVVDGVDVYRYRLAPLKSALLKPVNFIVSNWQLFKLMRRLRKEHPDAKVFGRYHFGVLAAIAAGFNRVAYLVPSIIDNQVKVELKQSDRMLQRVRSRVFMLVHAVTQRQAIKQAKTFVFSTSMRQQCKQLLRGADKEYYLTKPGVDTARFYPVDEGARMLLRDSLGLPRDKRVVLFVGRFVHAKGVDLLIESLKQLPNHHLALVGEGVEKANYERLIAHWQLEGRVSIHPPTREVELYYRSADVFVMSSRYEPLGQTILEAFASGLPVVAFERGPEVDTATQELGMDDHVSYANEFSAASLANALQRCQAEETTRDRQVIAQAAQYQFNWQKLYQQLADF